MKERQEGWYWCKMHGCDEWMPWEFIAGTQVLKARWYGGEVPEEIGPRIPTPDETEEFKQ